MVKRRGFPDYDLAWLVTCWTVYEEVNHIISAGHGLFTDTESTTWKQLEAELGPK